MERKITLLLVMVALLFCMTKVRMLQKLFTCSVFILINNYQYFHFFELNLQVLCADSSVHIQDQFTHFEVACLLNSS